MQTSRNNEHSTQTDMIPTVYDQIVRLVAEHLQAQGFASVRANINGFSRPGRVKWEEEDEGVVPDLTGEHTGCTYVFVVETRDRIERKEVEDRWRLLAIHAKRHRGQFYLVVPETKASYIKTFIQDLNVQPKLLKLSGIQ